MSMQRRSSPRSSEAGIRPDGIATIWEISSSPLRRAWQCCSVSPATRRTPSMPHAARFERASCPPRSVSRRRGLAECASLDELFAASELRRVPGGGQTRVRCCMPLGCIRVDDVESLPRGVLHGPRCRIGRRTLVLCCRQRSVGRAVPRWRRVRRRPDHARRRVCVLERLAELADRRTIVPGDRPALPSGPQPPPGRSSRRPQHRDSEAVRAAPRGAPHRGQVHISGSRVSSRSTPAWAAGVSPRSCARCGASTSSKPRDARALRTRVRT